MADDDKAAGNGGPDVTPTTDVRVYPARAGMTYHGPIVERDAQFHYQQVAPNTLIAHARDDSPVVAAMGSDTTGRSLTAMYDNEATRQAALHAARELGSDPHVSMPRELKDHAALREAFELGRGDAYGIDY
jgi:hypothetical protein